MRRHSDICEHKACAWVCLLLAMAIAGLGSIFNGGSVMEVISAWEIYWVLQLDSICVAMALIAFAGIIVVPVSWGMWADDGVGLPLALPVLATPLWLLALLLAIFLPSTKTAAAMFIVPKLANNEAIQAEAGEIYTLAKDALRKAVADDKPAKEAE